MTQQDILNLMDKAFSTGNMEDVQKVYKTGKQNLQEMPKVHDSYAIILLGKGNKKKAYTIIKSAISENKKRHKRIQGVESAYDYGLSHYNAVVITKGEPWLTNNEKVHHLANAFWYLLKSEHMNYNEGALQDRGEKGWSNSFFGEFLPTYYKGELLKLREFSTLPMSLNIRVKEQDHLYAAFSALSINTVILRRCIKQYQDPNVRNNFLSMEGGASYLEWIMNIYKTYLKDTSKAMQEIEGEIGSPNPKLFVKSEIYIKKINKALKNRLRIDPDFKDISS